jgi:hypothetical protein
LQLSIITLKSFFYTTPEIDKILIVSLRKINIHHNTIKYILKKVFCMSDTALSAIATSTINRLGQVARQSTSAEKALVTGEKSLDDVSPSAAAHAQSAKNAIAFAKGTAIRSVEANAVTEVIINAITEGIQILTEAIGTAASEVNNLNTPETKVHTNYNISKPNHSF